MKKKATIILLISLLITLFTSTIWITNAEPTEKQPTIIELKKELYKEIRKKEALEKKIILLQHQKRSSIFDLFIRLINPISTTPQPNNNQCILANELKNKGVNFQLIDEIITKMEQKYVDAEKINPTEISYGIAKGLVYSLEDPYSSYLTPEESNDFEESIEGELQGIGAELTMRRGLVTVISPLKKSPAMKAGLKPEDIIMKVDDQDITQLNLFQVVKKIRGTPGTKVKLTVARKTADDFKEIEITRAQITVESVILEMKDDIAVLELNQFGYNTRKEWDKYITQAIIQEPKAIILDLRYNSGGLLEMTKDIVGTFVGKNKKVAIVKSRNEQYSVMTKYNPTITEIPLVILQNRGSASASEIVAGALKDYDKAKIIGTTSFGKGTVQELVPLRAGGELRITIAEWLTPNGTSINEKGIEPDYYIERTLEDHENNKDPQMEAAIKLLNGEDITDLITKKK